MSVLLVCPQPNGTDESVHYDQWTLAAGEQTIVSHEYIVSRFWQVMDSPEPPSATAIAGEEKRHRCFCFLFDLVFSSETRSVSTTGPAAGHTHRQISKREPFSFLKKRSYFLLCSGWKVWYPMDSAGVDARDDSQAGQTMIDSGSEALDSVWELTRFTGRTGAMDVNTDSNARQRDNCNIDSHITAMHQAAAGPAASANYRRRNGFFLFEPDAKVHPWSEFKLASLGAVHEYTLDTGDLSLANETFDNLLEHYSLSKFIQQEPEPVRTPPIKLSTDRPPIKLSTERLG